jgi:hypothetical protein
MINTISLLLSYLIIGFFVASALSLLVGVLLSKIMGGKNLTYDDIIRLSKVAFLWAGALSGLYLLGRAGGIFPSRGDWVNPFIVLFGAVYMVIMFMGTFVVFSTKQSRAKRRHHKHARPEPKGAPHHAPPRAANPVGHRPAMKGGFQGRSHSVQI